MREDCLCAADLPVTLLVTLPLGDAHCEIGLTMGAKAWADLLGVPWDTARQRRYRGDSWSDAFQPYLRKTSFNSRALEGISKKDQAPGIARMLKAVEACAPAQVCFYALKQAQ